MIESSVSGATPREWSYASIARRMTSKFQSSPAALAGLDERGLNAQLPVGTLMTSVHRPAIG